MDEATRLEKLKKYMKDEFGITPENIDEKLSELKVEFYKPVKAKKYLEGGQAHEKITDL